MWSRFVPFVLWWSQINRHTLRADSLAALTGAIVALPQGVAFAAIAGLPPEYGLYAAMAPVAVAAIFGSSLIMIHGDFDRVVLLAIDIGYTWQRDVCVFRINPDFDGWLDPADYGLGAPGASGGFHI
jgi:MFS superfamily sulfate permease-like transporter